MAVRKRAAASAASSSAKDEDADGNACKRSSSSINVVKNNTPSATNNNEGEKPPLTKSCEQDELSLIKLIPAIMVSSLVSVGSYYSCESIEMAEDALVATVRTCLQLSLLAALLSPLFRFVDNQTKSSSVLSGSSSNRCSNLHFWKKMKEQSAKLTAPFLVLAYVFCFMLPLAAYEASSRTKLTLRPTNPTSPYNNIVLLIVIFSLFTAVSTMGAVAIFTIIKPVPRFSPRHVIPICGMLFNNALSGISLALDVLFTELQSTHRGTIELMISFGADAWTATRPSFRSVLASSLKPQINSMNVIGLVAIPGMMTGQVLAGASPTRAARYQIIIMCLILGAVFIAVGMTAELVIWNAFNERGALRDDWIVDNNSLRVSQLISALAVVLKPLVQGGLGRSEGIRSPLQDLDRAESSVIAVELFTEAKKRPRDGSLPYLQVNLHGSFAKGKRMMTANFDIPTNGDIAILKGVSGIGKSTLLKTIAELNSGFIPSTTSSMTISLSGRDRKLFHPSEWRQRVLYLPQDGSSMLQGTPHSFLTFIATSLHHTHSLNPPTLESLASQTTNYMEAWGIQSPLSILSQPWAKLSGGESQRVILAIALATEPKLLLVDEPTSALDLESKLKVEDSLKKSAQNGCAMIVVTHDEDQMRRLGTIRMTLDVVSE
eukprot:CAMPEP_0201873864 /NCGR_PEP_ID=MMETSP0902-20130614/6258_1 /ASSEMBLY_ACC=CAM_ASM_000551 /TAXON_ID=420261 /ORGANISM="Thalassiosira antarctica, Strain CCMP982" /LENGTH=659 /DNA_ID=CAMNT_0048400569 /DNA_START=19 /DNA_END=1998 /DNA_ORIENTATION=+